LVQYSDRFRATYRAYKENCSNIDISEKDQAMDFFHGLDSNRYGAFKANMMNGWASKAISKPDTVNTIYRLAGSWVKTNNMKAEGRTAVTFVTTTENSKSCAPKGKKSNMKSEENLQKKAGEKDLSKITCFVCGEKGHYASKCPKKGKPPKSEDDNEADVNATWEVEQQVNMFVTVKEHVINNAVGKSDEIASTKVLLDNQADISILHPSLLSDVREAEAMIRVKGVGGYQWKSERRGC
jgi:Zinc knuckle